MHTPMPESVSEFSEQLRIPNDSAYLKEARDWVKNLINQTVLQPPEHMRVILAIDEAISNVIEHAYEDEGRNDTIELEVISTDTCLIVKITDQGVHFDPSHIPDVNMEEHIRAQRKNGLGIFMIRQIMDEIEYSFKEGVCNTLKLVKYYKEQD